MKAGDPPPETSISAARILKGVGSIDRLMNDLSILVRSRMRVQLPLTKTSADMGQICKGVLEEVKLSHGKVDFKLETIGDLSGTWDHERLGQVIFNLAANAVIHGQAKRVHIIAEGRAHDIVVRVMNRGVTIPAEMRDSIFDPFVSTNTAPARKSLGLGLFIVKEIANGHEGTVEVASSESEGTAFTVRLPRVLPSRTAREALHRS